MRLYEPTHEIIQTGTLWWLTKVSHYKQKRAKEPKFIAPKNQKGALHTEMAQTSQICHENPNSSSTNKLRQTRQMYCENKAFRLQWYRFIRQYKANEAKWAKHITKTKLRLMTQREPHFHEKLK